MQTTRTASITLLWALTVAAVIVWDQNTFSIAASGLGVAATLLLLFGLRWWRAIGAAASLLFVANWALAFVHMGGGAPFEAYAQVVQGATESNTLIGRSIVLGYEVILPLVHLAVTMALIVGLVKAKD